MYPKYIKNNIDINRKFNYFYIMLDLHDGFIDIKIFCLSL